MNRAAAITLGWIVGCASFASAGVYAPVAEGEASRAILIVGDKASLPKLEVWPGSSQPRTPGTWGQTVRIDCLNYNFRVWINGKLLLGADDWYGPRTGRVALEIRDAQAAFDDVVVTQID